MRTLLWRPNTTAYTFCTNSNWTSMKSIVKIHKINWKNKLLRIKSFKQAMMHTHLILGRSSLNNLKLSLKKLKNQGKTKQRCSKTKIRERWIYSKKHVRSWSENRFRNGFSIKKKWKPSYRNAMSKVSKNS
jgi:hypothetical protein